MLPLGLSDVHVAFASCKSDTDILIVALSDDENFWGLVKGIFQDKQYQNKDLLEDLMACKDLTLYELIEESELRPLKKFISHRKKEFKHEKSAKKIWTNLFSEVARVSFLPAIKFKGQSVFSQIVFDWLLEGNNREKLVQSFTEAKEDFSSIEFDNPKLKEMRRTNGRRETEI